MWEGGGGYFPTAKYGNNLYILACLLTALKRKHIVLWKDTRCFPLSKVTCLQEQAFMFNFLL